MFVSPTFVVFIETRLPRVAKSAECMPLSNVTRSPLQEQQTRNQKTNQNRWKRRISDTDSAGESSESPQKQSASSVLRQNNKKLKGSGDSHDDTAMDSQSKKPNFSALSSPNNGFNRSPLVNNKPVAAKKLIIKNLRGEDVITVL